MKWMIFLNYYFLLLILFLTHYSMTWNIGHMHFFYDAFIIIFGYREKKRKKPESLSAMALGWVNNNQIIIFV